MRLFVRIISIAFALWVVTLIPVLQVSVTPFSPGETPQLILTFLIVGALFGLVNAVIGTVIKVIAFPLYILTLGLISFIVNAFLLWLTAWITGHFGWGLEVDHFGWAIVAAILISLINAVLGGILRPQKKKHRR